MPSGINLWTAEEASAETQRFAAMYQRNPSVEYQINEDDSILDGVSDGENSEDE